MKFEIEESAVISESEQSSLDTLATQIPSLMLNFLPLGVYRTVYPEEVLDRDLYEINKNKQTQYETLHNAIVTRDALLFSNSGFNLRKKIKESESSIKTAKEKIASYEEEEKTTLEKFENNKKKKNTSELVAIYKNDSSKLFETKNSVISQKEVNSASIRGLITGKIIYNHGFLQVESTLTLYPKNVVIASAAEIGMLDESEYIAQTLMNVLLEAMINDDLIEADILIFPKTAGDNSTIYIEDSVYHGCAVTAMFTSGKHTIRVESPGFDTVFFTMDYEPNKDKLITIEMNEKIDKEILFEKKLTSAELKKKKVEGDSPVAADADIVQNEKITGPEIYLNTFYYGHLPLVANIDENSMLGESVTPEGNSAYFLLKTSKDSKKLKKDKSKDKIDSTIINSQNQNINVQDIDKKNPDSKKAKEKKVSVPVAKQNIEKRIDLTRKIMYWSYGALILTVPVYYYFSGMSELVEVNSYMTGNTSSSVFSTGKTISMYVMIGAGVNFLTQLAIYLVNANKVIPTVVYAQDISEQDEQRIEQVKQMPEVEQGFGNEKDENEDNSSEGDSKENDNKKGENGDEQPNIEEQNFSEDEQAQALKEMQEMQELLKSMER